MGSTTSKIATSRACAHFAAGPIALIVAFIGNILVNITSENLFKPTGWALIFGGVTLFVVNYLIAAFYSVPSSMEAKCNKEPSTSQRLLYPLWPALFSAIGDPNIVAIITYSTPLIIFAPIITALLPPGPLTIGLSMLLRYTLGKLPVIGTLINIFPLTKVFDQLTSSWFFIAALFLIGYNFWSWVGAAIANTQAMNNNCQ